MLKVLSKQKQNGKFDFQGYSKCGELPSKTKTSLVFPYMLMNLSERKTKSLCLPTHSYEFEPKKKSSSFSQVDIFFLFFTYNQ